MNDIRDMQKLNAAAVAKAVGIPQADLMEAPPAPFDEWCLVELMGHQKVAGHVTTRTIAGAQFLQVDVPDNLGETRYTRFYGPSAVYCIHPIAKQIATGWTTRNAEPAIGAYDLLQLSQDKPVQISMSEGDAGDDCQ